MIGGAFEEVVMSAISFDHSGICSVCGHSPIPGSIGAAKRARNWIFPETLSGGGLVVHGFGRSGR